MSYNTSVSAINPVNVQSDLTFNGFNRSSKRHRVEKARAIAVGNAQRDARIYELHSNSMVRKPGADNPSLLKRVALLDRNINKKSKNSGIIVLRYSPPAKDSFETTQMVVADMVAKVLKKHPNASVAVDIVSREKGLSSWKSSRMYFHSDNNQISNSSEKSKKNGRFNISI